jgi:hypothetical protein
MNVREMLEEIPKRFPSVAVVGPAEPDRSPDWNWFRVELENGWIISCGYGRANYCDNRVEKRASSLDSETVEIAIFTADHEWYIAEGMSIVELEQDFELEDGITVTQVSKSGVLGWQTADQLFRIIEYISTMSGPSP